MFETLFTRPYILARHRTSPSAESRESFLIHCAEQGVPRSTLRKIAWVLVTLSQSLDLRKPHRVTQQEIEFAVDHRVRFCHRPEHAKDSVSSRRLFIHIATAWFRFLGTFEEQQHEPKPFAHYVEDFANFMREERGLSPVTITTYCDEATNFLAAVKCSGTSLGKISIKDVDAYLAYQGKRGWSRGSLHQLAGSLRRFFWYAEAQGWVRGIARAIEAPRLYAQEGLPLGPTWEEVQQLIASFGGDSAADIRGRAIVMLLAMYGLRRGEVARIRLDDVDWQSEILHVTRSKQRCTQQYPLVRAVGDVLLRYLQEVRPRCNYRELFLTIHTPVRPLSPGSISAIVRSRLANLDIQVPRNGAHCLRHACARHLLASGFSLKQIGDHLGHRSASATRTYAKVDLVGLREVAELDLRSML